MATLLHGRQHLEGQGKVGSTQETGCEGRLAHKVIDLWQRGAEKSYRDVDRPNDTETFRCSRTESVCKNSVVNRDLRRRFRIVVFFLFF